MCLIWASLDLFGCRSFGTRPSTPNCVWMHLVVFDSFGFVWHDYLLSLAWNKTKYAQMVLDLFGCV